MLPCFSSSLVWPFHPPPPFPGHWSGSDAPLCSGQLPCLSSSRPRRTCSIEYVSPPIGGSFWLPGTQTNQKSLFCSLLIRKAAILPPVPHILILIFVSTLLSLQLCSVCQHQKQLLPSKNLKSFTAWVAVFLWNAEMTSYSEGPAMKYRLKYFGGMK